MIAPSLPLTVVPACWNSSIPPNPRPLSKSHGLHVPKDLEMVSPTSNFFGHRWHNQFGCHSLIGLVISFPCLHHLELPQEGVMALGGQCQRDKHLSLWIVWAILPLNSNRNSADWSQSTASTKGVSGSKFTRKQRWTWWAPTILPDSPSYLHPHIAWGPDVTCTVLCGIFSSSWGSSSPQSLSPAFSPSSWVGDELTLVLWSVSFCLLACFLESLGFPPSSAILAFSVLTSERKVLS